jgi:hypothetical protein
VPALAAAALSYHAQILEGHGEHKAAQEEWRAAIRVDRNSPAGLEAQKKLTQTTISGL